MKIKKEIVTFDGNNYDADKFTAKHTNSDEWNKLITDKQTLIIDARPPAKLLPNRRRHWSDNYRKDVKDYLTLVWIRCKEQKIQPVKGHATLTFIFYLNDNFTGGETDFPKRNIKAKPKTGKAVLFFNLNDDNTGRRDKSFHAGLPPNTGEKWMCNKWIRMNSHT